MHVYSCQKNALLVTVRTGNFPSTEKWIHHMWHPILLEVRVVVTLGRGID